MPKITHVSYVSPFGDYSYILVHRGEISHQYNYTEDRLNKFYELGLINCTGYNNSLVWHKTKVLVDCYYCTID